MAHQTVELVWKCKTEKGWRYYPVVWARNGRPLKGKVKVGDEECYYPEGSFFTRWYEGKQTKYGKIGGDPNKALDALRVKENELKAILHAGIASMNLVPASELENRYALTAAAATFIKEAKQRGSKEAGEVYERDVTAFLSRVGKMYADELTVEDMLDFTERMTAEGYAARTVHNRWANVKAFYLFLGFDPKKVPRDGGNRKPGRLIAPKYEEKTVEIYGAELGPFFRQLEDDQRVYVACQIMLKCGLREQEMTYLEWRNVHLDRGFLHVEGNARYDFKVKDSEQRDIPIPRELVRWLGGYRERNPGDRLVAPTETGEPDSNYLRKIKIAARAAGLNCGGCATCLHTKSKECKRWYLHKFRATAITTWLRSREMGGAGLDLRTVMRLSGHSDLGSVSRYLSPADNETVRGHIDGITWAA